MDNGHPDGYLHVMTHYSVAEAKNNLPKLLDRMLAGEEVVITRRGKPIGTLQPTMAGLSSPPFDIEWLRRVRIKPKTPVNAVDLVRQMRDED